MGQNKITPNEKVAICYTCCGPTYRESAREKLINTHYDDDNIYYFVITDDKEYFEGIERKNLVVNELKDFYGEYPEIEKNEWFLESESAEDYGKKFNELNYRFPFSTNRFHFKQVEPYGITNVVMIATDTDFVFSNLNNNLEPKNNLINAVTRWKERTSEHNMHYVVDILKEEFNLDVEEELWIYDGAAKFFIFDNIEIMMRLFEIWTKTMKILHEKNIIKKYQGSYAVNDEYILAPILNALGIVWFNKGSYPILFQVNHNPKKERFWL